MNTSVFRIGDYIPKYPIVQGGMGVRISLSNLASSVANQGGIGVIATSGIGMTEPDFSENFSLAGDRALVKEIRRAKKKSSGILGINVMGVLNNFSEIVQTSIAEGINIIFTGAGLPLDLPKYLVQKTNTALVPIISSSKAAYLITKRWIKRFSYLPDAIVLEGPKAGGHLGFKYQELSDPNVCLENILPEVLKMTEEISDKKIPVIVAGGIFTQSDMEKYLSMGASAVQLGTRFVATDECDASDEFKQSYVNCLEKDLRIINSPVGLPGRAIGNKFLADVESGLKKPYKCPFHCITTCNVKDSPYCIASALMHAQSGNLDQGFAFAGSNVHRIKKIGTVKSVFSDLLGKEI